MTMKIAVSLPDHLVAEARAAVAAGSVASVSAYVAEALAEKSERRSLGEVLSQWRSEVGPAAAEEDGWAERALGVPDEPSR